MLNTRPELIEDLQTKFKALDETLWERRGQWTHVEKWANQFKSNDNLEDDEQLQMLFLASHFMYFGLREIRCLLRSLFRDVYKYDLVASIRRANHDTTDRKLIDSEFQKALASTRFLGVGNPSESGSHLLYYFRQENRLGKLHFINSHEVFGRGAVGGAIGLQVRDPTISRYVFIDDLCGSGIQAGQYTKDIIEPLKRLNPGIRVSYYPLFATSYGLGEVRKLPEWDDVQAVVELDESFKCFAPNSRIYKSEKPPYQLLKAKAVAQDYGRKLYAAQPLGWLKGQLLIGFCHNTPDNTLPIIWYDEPNGEPWTPLFRRYPKHYGWET
jgi:hypothetical protein